ncbi:MAG: hypothetical protein EHM28_15350, partial [Spirochaetaceae bacterium]
SLTEKGVICAASALSPAFASAVYDSKSSLQKTSLLLAALLLEVRNPKYGVNDFSLLEPTVVLRDPRLSAAAHKEARIFGFKLVEDHDPDFDMTALVGNFANGIGLRDREKNYRLSGGPNLALKAGHDAPDALVVFRGDHRTATGVIHQYISLDAGLLRPVLKQRALIVKELVYSQERRAFSAVQREVFGSLVLSETRGKPDSMGDFAEVFYRLLEKEGISILDWNEKARLLRERISCLKAAMVTDETLIKAIKVYYGDTLKDPGQIRIADVLMSMVKPSLRKQIQDLDEKRFKLENGRFARIRYEKDGRIIVSARVQDFFGVRHNPVIAGVSATAELLSPAGRPVQLTSDLAGFWKSGYQSVRKDLAGRYPKHKWPTDPMTREIK